MTVNKSSQFGTLITIFLIVIIIAGGIVIWLQHDNRPVEIAITNPPSQEPPGYVYIDGAVTNPGLYPLKDGDSMGTLIQAAGGATSDADTSLWKLYIPVIGEEKSPQKVNINRAETWLLEALPGIGKTKAQAIIDYRRQSGQFHNTNEITKVEGISLATYEKIESLITVID